MREIQRTQTLLIVAFTLLSIWAFIFGLMLGQRNHECPQPTVVEAFGITGTTGQVIEYDQNDSTVSIDTVMAGTSIYITGESREEECCHPHKTFKHYEENN
jgi:hypothetical protein